MDQKFNHNHIKKKKKTQVKVHDNNLENFKKQTNFDTKFTTRMEDKYGT